MQEMNNKPHILFVCGQNRWRSPTAARIYANDQRIEVRSAGVSGKSVHKISNQDVEWADIVFVMEQKYKTRLLGTFRGIHLPPIISLDIPDDYKALNGVLVELIREGTESNLKHRFGIEAG